MPDTVKEKVLKAVQALPDESSFEDVMKRVYFLYKMEKGLQRADAGETVSHGEAKQRMQK